ncbi:hypothetical protein [Aeoliella sp.]|uniref:hypothetical protein n=1 Tax=Aeoliella sp. TaxID=2795800 RepID=UPI003CCC13C8
MSTITFVLEPSDNPASNLRPTIPPSRTFNVVFDPIDWSSPITIGGASMIPGGSV